MQAIAICVVAIAAAGCASLPDSHAETPARGFEVTYLGNEGFLVSAAGHSVLIDALQGPGLDGYESMPAGSRDELEQAKPPFDQVELVLATHHHPDHLNVASVARFMKANPRARLLSTPEAVRRLSQGTGLGDRLIALSPKVGEPVRREVGEIVVEAFRLHHGNAGEIDNFGYLVTIGGASFLHVGDTMVTAAEMAVERIHEREVALYFVPYWQLLNVDRDARLAAVGASEVVAMHIPSEQAPASWLDPFSNRAELLRAVRGDRERNRVFEKVGERRTIGNHGEEP